MPIADELRAEADRSDALSRQPYMIGAYLAHHHWARARLYDRCATSAEEAATRVEQRERELAETEAWLGEHFAEEREARRLAELQVRAAWRRCETEAPELMRQWRRAGR